MRLSSARTAGRPSPAVSCPPTTRRDTSTSTTTSASFVGSATYSAHQLFASATAIHGSGLTNGLSTFDIPRSRFGTGLTDFNSAFKVAPSTIVNASAGYTFLVGRTVVRPQVYVDNVFDRHYLLKGTFFSGASAGRPRSVQLRINVGL